jgi:acyl dehydratase
MDVEPASGRGPDAGGPARRRFVEAVGQVRRSAWMEITQARIDAFADATDDHEWVHVDRDAAARSAFGSTIAHGLLTLSLGPHLSRQLFALDTTQGSADEAAHSGRFAYGLNYGFEKVRFTAPLPVGSRVRLRATLLSVEDVPGGIQVAVEQAFEREGTDKPVCVAIGLARLYY